MGSLNILKSWFTTNILATSPKYFMYKILKHTLYTNIKKKIEIFEAQA